MVSPISLFRATPTGRLSVRNGLFGRLVLQVEERLDYFSALDREQRVTSTSMRWRDARVADVVPTMQSADAGRQPEPRRERVSRKLEKAA